MPTASSASRKRGWSQPRATCAPGAGRCACAARSRARRPLDRTQPAAARQRDRAALLRDDDAERVGALRQAERRRVARADARAAARDRSRAAGARRSARRGRPRSTTAPSWPGELGSKSESSSGSEMRPSSSMPPSRWRSSGSRPAHHDQRAGARRGEPRHACARAGRASRAAGSSSRRRDTERAELLEDAAQVVLEHHHQHEHEDGEEGLEERGGELERRAGAPPGRWRRAWRGRAARAARACGAGSAAPARPAPRRRRRRRGRQTHVAEQRRSRASCSSSSASGHALERRRCTRRRDTSSTVARYGPTSTLSPRRGSRAEPRRHVAADRVLILVLLPLELEVEPVADLGQRHAAAQLVDAAARPPRTRAGPRRTRRRAGPTISSSASSRKARPITVPCSSTTAAQCARLRLHLEQEVRERHLSVTKGCSRASCPRSGSSPRSTAVEHALGVHEADDRVEPALAERVARVVRSGAGCAGSRRAAHSSERKSTSTRGRMMCRTSRSIMRNTFSGSSCARGVMWPLPRREGQDAADLLGRVAGLELDVGERPTRRRIALEMPLTRR